MTIMRILIAGGTGLIGKKLSGAMKSDGDSIVILTRGGEEGQKDGINYVRWSGRPDDLNWVGNVGEIDAVCNLSGRSIADSKWTQDVKKDIANSRIDATRTVVEGIRKMEVAPRALISASAIGYYGSRGDEVLTEDSEPGTDFFAELCVKWEEEALKARDNGIRVVTLRTSIALEGLEGALPQIVTPLKKGLGSRLGNGKQWVSWIHSMDAAEAVKFLLKGNLEGPFNIASPNPVINKDFMQAIAKSLGKKPRIPAPASILRATLGEMADYLLLSSQRVSSEKLSGAGFKFTYPYLDKALEAIFREGQI